LRSLILLSGSSLGMAASGRLLVEQQHEELLAHQHLEPGSVMREASSSGEAAATPETAFVHHPRAYPT